MGHKELGKITSIRFGRGGYDDAMFGVSFVLGSDASGCMDFWGTWSNRPDYAKWSKEDQIRHFGDTMMKLKNLMEDAKVSSIEELEGTPVEMEFESIGGRLTNWRVLKEVL